MQLTHYISDLLYRYECVIIPGFGAFLTHQDSARIDSETNTFYPPFKRVSFNRQLQTNDGLLANYIASAEGISYEEALGKLREFASSLNHDIQIKRTLTFSKIGNFYCNDGESVQFVPDNQENFSTDSFGLGSFVLPKIKREFSATLKESSEAPVIDISKRKSPSYIKYAAAAAVALLATGIGGMKWHAVDVQNSNLAEREKAATLIENKIQEATFVIDNPLPALNLNIARQRGDFHIVAGAFKDEENAQKKASHLKEKGYHPHIIKTRHGLHQVLFESFETKHEALVEMNRIQREENSDAWLLVQKLD